MISFIPFDRSHVPLFRSWLQEDHVKLFWQETDNDEELTEKYLGFPKRNIWPFIIQRHSQNIGYIQYYRAHQIGNGWWENEPVGTFGIDVLIGPFELTGSGLGPSVIQEFMKLIQKREPVKSFIIDPDPENIRAVKAFQKAGFLAEGEIETPNGRALLLRYRCETRENAVE